MPSCLLKKALPFVLTFALGATLAGPVRRFLGFPPDVLKVWRTSEPSGPIPCYFGHDPDAPRSLIILYKPDGFYERASVSKGATDYAWVRVTFGADAKVQDVRVTEALPFVVNEAAKKAAWQIEFIPAAERGRPVTVTKQVKIHLQAQ